MDGLVPPDHPREGGLRAPDGPARGSERGEGSQNKAAAPDGEQPDGVQSRAWPGLPLSVPALRRRLWRLVLAGQQTAHPVWAWASWRRREQAPAK